MIFFRFLGNDEDHEDDSSTEIIKGIISTEKREISTKLPQLTIIDEQIFDQNDKLCGLSLNIVTPKDMQTALDLELGPEIKFLHIETKDWHIIPLENLIAKFSNLDVKIMASAKKPEDIALLSNILELGVDICVIHASLQFPLELFLNTIDQTQKLDLIEFEIESIERIGVGDRVCVDTVSILNYGEGLLVGSSSKAMLLVQAEVEESGFVNSRPFRVNAGVVSSYTLSGEKTNYLSEIKAGSKVMIVSRDGYTRDEYVARAKIERRPLILVRFTNNIGNYSVVLQDAETVKLVSKDEAIRVDQLRVGMKILGIYTEGARHFGMSINESIEEK